jgi:hypothetical protein
MKIASACTCSKHKSTYAPHATREETPVRLVEHLSVEERRTINAAMESYYVDMARHEAGHAVAAAATGRVTDYATIGNGAPHVKYCATLEPPSVLDIVITTIAGDVAARVGNGDLNKPSATQLLAALRKAREGDSGRCDACHVAKVLTTYFPECTDEKIVETWCGLIVVTHSLLFHDEVRGAMLALGRELHDKTLLHRDEIESIFARYDLRAAYEEALGSLDLMRLLPAWKECLEESNGSP